MGKAQCLRFKVPAYFFGPLIPHWEVDFLKFCCNECAPANLCICGNLS